MIYIFSELHCNSDTRSIFNHSFYKDLQIEGIFDVLSRLAINQGGRSLVALTPLWFINTWQNITLIRQPSKFKHYHCLCYHRNLHWDVARRCGGEKRGKMPFYETGLQASSVAMRESGSARTSEAWVHWGVRAGRARQPSVSKGRDLAVTGCVHQDAVTHPPSLSQSLSITLFPGLYFLLSAGTEMPKPFFLWFAFWDDWNQMIAEPNPFYWNPFKLMCRP